MASTVQWPLETASAHWALTLAVRTALIFVDAWLHASVSSASGALPSVGAMAVHVSVTPRSLSIAMHAFRTLVSRPCATVTRFAEAVKNAFVSPSIDRLATETLRR